VILSCVPHIDEAVRQLDEVIGELRKPLTPRPTSDPARLARGKVALKGRFSGRP
jgi:hypothetical protein